MPDLTLDEIFHAFHAVTGRIISDTRPRPQTADEERLEDSQIARAQQRAEDAMWATDAEMDGAANDDFYNRGSGGWGW